MTAKEINKKYRGKYIQLFKTYDYGKQRYLYKVGKVYNEVHEDTTLGEDVGTAMEYRR